MKPFVNIILMLVFVQAYGQSKPLMPLKIGGKMPEVTIGEFWNYKTRTAKISDFKGKLLIIDFWNRWCGSCIRSFPHMENLQKQFGNKIVILLVTDDPMEAFEKLHKRSPTLQLTTLPFVIGDSTLHTLFPHRTVPYHIWIDEEGTVITMTEGSNATASNIQDVLDGKEVALTKRETQNFDFSGPLIEEGNGRQLKYLQYYSLIMHRLPGTPKGGSGILRDSITKRFIGVRKINTPIVTLYEDAFSFVTLFTNGAGKVIVESHNMDRFYPPADNGKKVEWDSKNSYCYELKWPPSVLRLPREKQMEKSREIMRQDLDRFFQIKSCIETRNERCLVLYRIHNQDKLKAKVKEGFTSDGDINDVIEKTPYNGWILKNVHFSKIPNAIRDANSGPNNLPIVDDTGYEGNIDATLNCDFADIPKLKIELAKYGLGLREAIRPITCLVLREVDDN